MQDQSIALKRVQPEENLAFVNERISAEDAEKYGLDAINEHFFMGAGGVRLWTIDREKNVYLRRMKSNQEEPTEHEMSFF